MTYRRVYKARSIFICALCVCLGPWLKQGAACVIVPDPQIGKVKTNSLSFASLDARKDWTVSGTGFDEAPVGSSVPIPSALFLFGSGMAGLSGLKKRQANRGCDL